MNYLKQLSSEDRKEVRPPDWDSESERAYARYLSRVSAVARHLVSAAVPLGVQATGGQPSIPLSFSRCFAAVTDFSQGRLYHLTVRAAQIELRQSSHET